MSTFPTLKCEIAFAANATVDPSAGQWVDVSAYLRSFSTKRGKNRDLDQTEAGTATIVLRNDDRRFDPENAASPYYPNVLPMRHIRLRAVYSSVTYELWRGFVDGWPQKWPGRPVANAGEAVVELTATDAFKIFSNITLSSEWARAVTAAVPKSWWRFGEAVEATTLTDSGPSRFSGAVEGSPTLAVEGLIFGDEDTAISFNTTGSDRFVIPQEASITSAQFTVEAWVQTTTASDYLFQQWAFPSVALTQITVSTTAGGVLIFTVIPTSGTVASVTGTKIINDGKPHHVIAVRDATTIKLYVDGAPDGSATFVDATSQLAQPAFVGNDQSPLSADAWTGTIDEVALYERALTFTEITQHYKAGRKPFEGLRTSEALVRILDYISWPTALRSIAAGGTFCQATQTAGATMLDILQKITLTEAGYMFIDPNGAVRFINRNFTQTAPGNVSQATFGDDTAELPYADLVLENDDVNLYNEAHVSRAGGTQVVAQDAASIAAYQTRTFDRSDLMTASDLEVVDYANWIVTRRKDAKTEVRSMVIRPESRATLWTQVLTREIGDLVTVKRRPPGGGAVISKTVRLEGIEHSVGNDRKWTTTYWLSGWNTASDQWWILGDSTYGKLDQTARLGF